MDEILIYDMQSFALLINTLYTVVSNKVINVMILMINLISLWWIFWRFYCRCDTRYCRRCGVAHTVWR